MEDIGCEHLHIKKCKGHASAGDVSAGRATEFTKVANDNADHFAGQGVDCAEQQSPAIDDKARYSEARRWYRWLLAFCADWPADTQPRSAEVECTLPRLPSRLSSEQAVVELCSRVAVCGHMAVTCNDQKAVKCLLCQERRPASDMTYWTESPCTGKVRSSGSCSSSSSGSSGQHAVNQASPEEDEEQEADMVVVGTPAYIQGLRAKRDAEAASRRRNNRRMRVDAAFAWVRSLPTDGSHLKQVRSKGSPPHWITRLSWQTHRLYTAGGIAFCNLCGHMVSCFRAGALHRGCGVGKHEAIKKGSVYRRDQMLMGSLAGTTLTQWPDGSPEHIKKPVLCMTAAMLADLEAAKCSAEFGDGEGLGERGPASVATVTAPRSEAPRSRASAKDILSIHTKRDARNPRAPYVR